jgi:hypothetical protein
MNALDPDLGMARVTGRVLDGDACRPLVGASVIGRETHTADSARTVVTDAEGNYAFVLPPGAIEIAIYYADVEVVWRVDVAPSTLVTMADAWLVSRTIIVH